MIEQKMNEKKVSSWLRALDIIIGIVAIVLGAAVLLIPDFGLETLIFMLYIALLFIGSGRILTGVLLKYFSRGFRIINIISGITLVGLAILVVVFPNFSIAFLVALFAAALLIYGMARIMIGGFATILPNWVRGLLVAGGIFTIIMSFVVLLSPGAVLLTLVFLLAIVLVWNGMDAIVSGVTGSA